TVPMGGVAAGTCCFAPSWVQAGVQTCSGDFGSDEAECWIGELFMMTSCLGAAILGTSSPYLSAPTHRHRTHEDADFAPRSRAQRMISNESCYLISGVRL